MDIEFLKNKINEHISDSVNLHSILYDSISNGPGKRMVIWFQGCPFACAGCFNPETWNYRCKDVKSTDDLIDIINNYNGDGITFSGGEPFIHSNAMLKILKGIKDFPKGVISFTGFEQEEYSRIPIIQECMKMIDVCIIGRYNDSKKQNKNIAGSSNQKFVFTSERNKNGSIVSLDDMRVNQSTEFYFTDDIVEVTGFPKINKKLMKELGLTLK